MHRPPSFLPSQPEIKPFTGNTRKSMFRLQETVRTTILKHGEKHIVVATLTFPHSMTSRKTAQKRLNSLFNDVRKMTSGYVWVLEYSQRRSIHFHLVLVVDFDVLIGTTFHLLPKQQYQTKADFTRCCNPALRAFWDQLERAARARGFGRIHLSPVVKNAEAVAFYFTKQLYTNWSLLARKEFERVRLWGCSRNLICTSRHFHFVNSPWKRAVLDFVAAEGLATVEEAVKRHGSYLETLVYQYAKNR